MTAPLVVLSAEQLEELVARTVRKVLAAVPASSGDGEVMTRDEVAALLKVTPSQVLKFRSRGLPAHRMGKGWRFRRSEILAWLGSMGGS